SRARSKRSFFTRRKTAYSVRGSPDDEDRLLRARLAQPLAACTFAASLIWPRRYSLAASGCLSFYSFSSFSRFSRLSWRSIVSRLRRCSARSRRSLALSLMTLSGTTPHFSSSLPLVDALFRLSPLGRRNAAVVSLISAFSV